MKEQSRRKFLHKTALASLGTAATATGIAVGETEAESALKAADANLAALLRSYGQVREQSAGGYQKVRNGSGHQRLPVTRLRVQVRDQDAFCRSFEELTGLSDRVLVEHNATRFARDGRYFIVENLVA